MSLAIHVVVYFMCKYDKCPMNGVTLVHAGTVFLKTSHQDFLNRVMSQLCTDHLDPLSIFVVVFVLICINDATPTPG